MEHKCKTCKHRGVVKSPMVQYVHSPKPWPLYGNELADYCWVGQIPMSVEGLNITACDVYEKEQKKDPKRFTPKEDYPCPICNAVAISEEALSLHMELEHPEKKLEAPESPIQVLKIAQILDDHGAHLLDIKSILNKHFK